MLPSRAHKTARFTEESTIVSVLLACTKLLGGLGEDGPHSSEDGDENPTEDGVVDSEREPGSVSVQPLVDEGEGRGGGEGGGSDNGGGLDLWKLLLEHGSGVHPYSSMLVGFRRCASLPFFSH